MKKVLFIFFINVVLVSCSKEKSATSEQSTGSTSKTVAVKPVVTKVAPPPASQAEFDFTTIALGGKLFKQNCARCHGENAEGNPHWRKRKPDGKLNPPPLNGTGHAWHHSKKLLMSIITTGTVNQGGSMPTWGNKLSQREIAAVVTWMQSKWPEKIYANWLEINKR